MTRVSRKHKLARARPSEDWRSTVYAEDENGNQIEPGYDEYIEVVIGPLVKKMKLENAKRKYSEKFFRITCESCARARARKSFIKH